MPPGQDHVPVAFAGLGVQDEDGDAIFGGPTTAARVVAAPVPQAVVLDGDGNLQFAAQDIAHAARGPHLAHLSLYEYVATVCLVKKKVDRGSEGDVDGDDDPNLLPPPARLRRRPANGRYPLDPCEFSDTHEHMLRSKFVVPTLAGPPPPRHPILTESDVDITPAKALELNSFAAFLLSLFTPWDRDPEDPFRAAPSLPLTWQSFVAWYTYDSALLPPASAAWNRQAVAPDTTAHTQPHAHRLHVGSSRPQMHPRVPSVAPC